MPNWCQNKYIVEGSEEALDKVQNWLLGAYPDPRIKLAVYQSRRFLLLGTAGYLRPTDPNAHYGLYPALTAHGLGQNTIANLAFTDWLTLFTGPYTITPELIRRINNLYHAAGMHFITWNDLSPDQQNSIARMMRAQSYDWFNIHERGIETLEEAFDFPYAPPDDDHKAADFHAVLPPMLHPLVNGFNANYLIPEGQYVNPIRSLSPEIPITEYDHNTAAYGTKWPVLYRDGCRPIDERVEGKALFTGETAWSPPLYEVDEAIRARFGLDTLQHDYMEEGIGYCGSRGMSDVPHWDTTDQLNAVYQTNGVEDEDGELVVISPDYIKNFSEGLLAEVKK